MDSNLAKSIFNDLKKEDLQNYVTQRGLKLAKTEIACAQRLLDCDVDKEDKDVVDLVGLVATSGAQSLKQHKVKTQLHQLRERLGILVNPQSAQPPNPSISAEPAKIINDRHNRDGVTATTPRHLLNAKYQKFPPDQIQHGRTNAAIRITWLIHYADKDWNENRICFYSSVPHLGGPFCFLSNFYKCTFYVPQWRMTFNCVEQQYQFAKAYCVCELADERFSTTMRANGKPVSSKQLPSLILSQDDPQTIADLGRAFCSYKKRTKAGGSHGMERGNTCSQ